MSASEADLATDRRRGVSSLLSVAGILAVLGAALCGAAWCLSSPVQASPDEDYHLTSIWCVHGTTPTCRPAPKDALGRPQVRVPALIGEFPPCFAFKNDVSALCQSKYPSMVRTPRVNHHDYPSGFYRVMSLFVSDSIRASVLMMRAFNVLLAVVLLAAIYLAAGPSYRRLLAYVLVPVGVPLGWFITASVNPSSWALTGLTAYSLGLYGFLVCRERWQQVVNAAAAAVGIAMSVSSRGDTAVYLVVVSVVVAIVNLPRLASRRSLLWLPLVASVIGVVALARSPQVASVAASSRVESRSSGTEIVELLRDFPNLVAGMFGQSLGLGWVDTPMPPITTVSVVVVVGFLLMTGAGLGGGWRKWVPVAILAVTMLGLPMWSLYKQRLGIATLQPRYLLPLMPILMLTIIIGRGVQDGLRLTRAQAWVVFVLLVVGQCAALLINTVRYVVGLGGTGGAGGRWWWPDLPDPSIVAALGSVGFAFFAYLVVRESGRRDLEESSTEERDAA